MKEHPILFSTEMVKAILAGTKTQTRRVVQPQPEPQTFSNGFECIHWHARKGVLYSTANGAWNPIANAFDDFIRGGYCPYGNPPGIDLWTRPTVAGWYMVRWDVDAEWEQIWLFEGGGTWGRSPFDDPESIDLDCDSDEIRWRTAEGARLWVRETHSRCNWQEPGKRYVVLKDGAQVYESGERFPGLAKYSPGAFDHIKWKPSIFMPRWASRLTLEITGVRVERVQEISEADAKAEGVSPLTFYAGRQVLNRCVAPEHRKGFSHLWDGINAPRGFGWDVNPFVWVVEFRRLNGKERG